MDDGGEEVTLERDRSGRDVGELKKRPGGCAALECVGSNTGGGKSRHEIPLGLICAPVDHEHTVANGVVGESGGVECEFGWVRGDE